MYLDGIETYSISGRARSPRRRGGGAFYCAHEPPVEGDSSHAKEKWQGGEGGARGWVMVAPTRLLVF